MAADFELSPAPELKHSTPVVAWVLLASNLRATLVLTPGRLMQIAWGFEQELEPNLRRNELEFYTTAIKLVLSLD